MPNPRSSHTWFVLKYAIGPPDVRNYDGSWAERSDLVRTPMKNTRAQSIP